jgi:ABC-type transport system involved in multi-copper enzyme maturation permease subunit
MMSALPGALVVKEGRALAPIWLGAVLVIVAATMAGMLSVALLAFIFAAAALGVFSIGHEYANKTLTSLLAQPLNRSRLLLSKVVVLAPLLVLLSLVVAVVLLQADGIDRVFGGTARAPGPNVLAAQPVDEALVSRWQLALVLLTPLLGLCVAPWLTMVCRNLMAGLVFTLAIPAGLWIAGQIARAVSVNFDFVELEVVHPFGYPPALLLMTIGIVAISALAVVHGRALFVGLEAVDTPRQLLPAQRQSPTRAIATAGRTRPRHPVWMLVQKEVQLQTIAFAVAGLYAVGWIGLSVARTEQYIAGQSFAMLTEMYGMFVALLVGALSSAEERSMGTAQWQMLQPLALWKQSLAKLVTIGLLTLLLGLAVPAILEAAFPLIVDSGRVGPRLPIHLWLPLQVVRGPVVTMLLITLFSAYGSTICSGGLRALLVALSVFFGLALLYSSLLFAIYDLRLVTHSFLGSGILRVQFSWQQEGITGTFAELVPGLRMADWAVEWTNAAMFAVFVAGILYLYFRNTRSAEHAASIARKQIPWIVVYVALAAVIAGVDNAFFQWWFLTR